MRPSNLRSTVLLSLAVAVLPAAAIAAELDDTAGIDAYLEQSVETTKIPGIVALVTDADGTLYSAAFGQRNASAGDAMTDDTIFRIASMTKPVAATAIMMVVEEGKLGLDDPIADYIPAFAGRPVIDRFNASDGSYTSHPVRSGPTIRQMLSHSSGLAYGFSNDVALRISGGAIVPDESVPLMYEPGTRWSYSQGISIVATVLERIEGMGLDTFLRERLFLPLGMHDTSFIVPASEHGRVATVHRLEAGNLVEDPNPIDIRSAVSGDGGLHSTAADYARFVRLILNDGLTPDGKRLLTTASIRELARNQLGRVRVSLQDEPMPQFALAFPLGADRDGFGLGFQVTGEHDDPAARSPGSLSWAGIYNTEFWIDRERGIGAVLLMQYLPFYDEDAIATLVGFEKRVYEHLD